LTIIKAAKEPLLPHVPLLFGHDDTPGIVSVEEASPGRMALWRRLDGSLVREEVEYPPFLLVSDREPLGGFSGVEEVITLEGEGFYPFMVRVSSMKDLERLARHLKKATGVSPSGYGAPYYYQRDPVHLYLLETGRTLFSGMTPEDVVTMALDIETYCKPGYEFSNPERQEDRITAIAVVDNRGREEVIEGRKLGEAKMLERLSGIVDEVDPDVILGHNIFKFDLSYIARRAALHEVVLPWGRDGRPPRMHRSRVAIAERVFDYPKWEIYGRHVIDTFILTLFYDIGTRELESFTLKEVARTLGISPGDRTYLEGERLSWYFENEPELLARYNLEDARETLALGRLLGRIHFIESQIFPYSYQNTIVRGAATKINSLMLREYLHRRAALPAPPAEAGELAGGYADLLEGGIIEKVYHCDAKSLYPSIILSRKIVPGRDHLKIFLPLLQVLTDFRLKAKEMAAGAEDDRTGHYLEALQGAFKILINSFYGYLASGLHHFSDPGAAAEVTAAGRKIIKKMMKGLEDSGCRIIEVDTDGVFFYAPGLPFSRREGEKLVDEISSLLPRGIDLELDGLYPVMFSYKTKNYALLDHEGRLVIKGSSLKSRGLEPYLRDYLRQIIMLALQGRAGEIEGLYNSLRGDIENHRIAIQELAKTETLVDSLELYREKVGKKRRNPKAVYELALASDREYRPGDQLSFYITGTRARVTAYRDCRLLTEHDSDDPDENVPYYLAKLADLDKKFRPLLTGDHDQTY
jgi:DNA polymerase elongation subunit (family B)